MCSGNRRTMSRREEYLLGIIADTHGLYDAAVERHFSGVSEILHAGDIGDPRVISRLEAIAPVVAVSGNVDTLSAHRGWPEEIVIRRGAISIGIRHQLYQRGKLTREAQTWLNATRPTVCVFGHSHQPAIERYGPTLLVNPGSAGPRRFRLPRGVALLIVQNGAVEARLIPLDDHAES